MVDLFTVHIAFSTVLIIGTARAQVSAPNCSDSSMAWSLNSLGQGPCLVVAYLLTQCNNGAFSMPSLLPQHSYSGPTNQDGGHLCRCNTVAYNMFSACDACQGEPWISYSAWSTNCTSAVTPGTFPKPIPVGTRVPRWALLDPTVFKPDDNWNLTAAQLVGDAPEVTGTGTVTVTPTPTTSSVSSNSPTKSSSNSGAIAGGVVGGITVVLLISGIVSWFAIRRRRAALTTPGHMTVVPHSLELSKETPPLYDPSNPSTYPTQPPPLIIHEMNDSNQFSDFESYPRPNRQGYSGRPEV